MRIGMQETVCRRQPIKFEGYRAIISSGNFEVTGFEFVHGQGGNGGGKLDHGSGGIGPLRAA